MIKRAITPKVLELAKKWPIIAIAGPRQSGKTTLVKNIFSGYQYFNLENPIEREFAKNDPQAFLSQSKQIVIDEVQRVPELFSYLQILVDDYPEARVVISGSQNFLLNEQISQTLAGRVARFSLLPLALREIRATKYWDKNMDKFIVKGFYPRLYTAGLKAINWYPNYLETYVERDVSALVNVGDKDRFISFVSACAASVGSVINYTSLANSVGISPNTAKSWLSILRQSYLAYTLKPYSISIKKQLRKSPKLYFYDSGLLCYLLGIRSRADYQQHYLHGQIFENFLIGEIQKKNFNEYTHHQFYYLRDKAGYEIDLLYQRGEKLVLIEVKAGQTLRGEMTKNLLYFQEELGRKTENYVLYGGKETQKRTRLTVLPWQNWVLE